MKSQTQDRKEKSLTEVGEQIKGDQARENRGGRRFRHKRDEEEERGDFQDLISKYNRGT